MKRFLIFFIFFFFYLSVYAVEKGRLEEGGQKVEDISLERPDTEVIEEAQKVFQIIDETEDSELMRDAQASDVVGERPDPVDVPTKVKIGLFVKDIALMDDAKQIFTASIVLVLRWIDPRLADPSAEIRKMPLDSVWNPLISIDNERDVTMKHEENVFVQSDGHVLYLQAYQGTFTVPLNLKDFPFDKHTLYLKVRSFYSPEEMKFIIDKSLTGWADKLSIPDWIVSNGEAKINTVYSKIQRREQSQFEFTFRINRLLGFYLWKIILPMALIVFISWGVFWIDPKRLEAQIGLSATTFLTLFAFQFAIAALLPRIAYLTRMDKYTMLCSLLVFLAIIKAVISSYYIKKEDYRTAKYIDYFARVLFPITFIGLMIFSFLA